MEEEGWGWQRERAATDCNFCLTSCYFELEFSVFEPRKRSVATVSTACSTYYSADWAWMY